MCSPDLTLFTRSYHTFYPDGPEKSESFGRIVNSTHAARIARLLDETKGNIVLGGAADVQQRYIAPTVVRDVKDGDALLNECVVTSIPFPEDLISCKSALREIFGPILPIVPVKDVDAAVSFIRARCVLNLRKSDHRKTNSCPPGTSL